MIDVDLIVRDILLAATANMPEAVGQAVFSVGLVASDMALLPWRLIWVVR